jgi:LPS-assembly protein
MPRTLIKILWLCLSGALCAPANAFIGDAASWWLCPVDRQLPLRPQYSQPVEPGSTEIRSDTTRIVKDDATEFAGNVEIVRDSRSISGDVVTYDDAGEKFDVSGNATIWDAGVIWQGQHALFDLSSDVGQLTQGNYWLTNGRGRGYAELLETDRNENVSVLQQVDYTTCATERPDWKFSASSITLDHDAGRGEATHALLKVHDVPVFYFPYINFPLDNKRKSGFLMPTIGTSNESGFDVKLPYYFNIAPNHDATFSPRWLAHRGVMFGGQYRYLTKNHKGRVGVEILPSDNLDNNNTRSLLSLQHETFFDGRRGRVEARIQNVSDARYFEDLGRSLSVTSQRFLDRRVEMRYLKRGSFSLRTLVQSHQNVDDSRSASRGPYRRLPQIRFRTLKGERHLRLTPNFKAETTYFDRSNSVSGARVDLTPSVSFPYIKQSLRVTPKLSLRHTEYYLSNEGSFNDHESRTIPVASLDTRLFAERRLNLFGSPVLQTFEPRAYYLYVPKDGQDDIPVFDSGQFDFSFRNLFRNNRFTGRDRIGDANQLTLAATSRVLDLNTGKELIRASFGQIYYFDNREITLPGRQKEKDDVSEFVAELAGNLGNGWSARAVVQYDPTNSTTERASYSVRYRPDNSSLVANASYRRRRAVTDVEQADLSFRLPIGSTLNLLGRWNYSLEKKRTLELVGGVEVDSCCWGLRLVGRRFIRNSEGQFDTGIFLQFEFKGLAGYGRGTESFLRKSIPGYETYF